MFHFSAQQYRKQIQAIPSIFYVSKYILSHARVRVFSLNNLCMCVASPCTRD